MGGKRKPTEQKSTLLKRRKAKRSASKKGRLSKNTLSGRNPGLLRKLIPCVLAVVLTGVPALYVSHPIGYLPVLSLLFLIGLSYGYLRLLGRSFRYEEKSDLQNCRRGTNIDFTVRLQNTSRLLFPKIEVYFFVSDIFGGDDGVTRTIITLAPLESRDFDFAVRFDHLGSYRAGLREIRLHDPLGLFTRRVESAKAYSVYVSPKIFHVVKLPVNDTALTEREHALRPTPMDGADYAGVREYRFGDPIKTIHWKLSARTEGYLTKQFESYGTVGLTIVMDFFSPVYDRETLMSLFDGIVETALSIGNHAEAQGLEYDVVYANRYGEKKTFHMGRQQSLVDIIKDMPSISTEEGEHRGVDLLREEGHSPYAYGNIAFCTANITGALITLLTELQQRRKTPMLFALVPKSLEGRERENFLKPLGVLEAAGIAFSVLSAAEELGGGEAE